VDVARSVEQWLATDAARKQRGCLPISILFCMGFCALATGSPTGKEVLAVSAERNGWKGPRTSFRFHRRPRKLEALRRLCGP